MRDGKAIFACLVIFGTMRETSVYTKQWNLISTMLSAKNTSKDGGAGRKQTLIKRAHELGKCPGIEVALFIRHRCKLPRNS
jgi:hypothetical protein